MGDRRTFLETERASRETLRWRGPWHVRGTVRTKSSVAGMTNTKRGEQDEAGNYRRAEGMGPKSPDEESVLLSKNKGNHSLARQVLVSKY